MMFKPALKTIAAATVASLMVVGSVTAFAQASQRIQFERGNDNASVMGSITGRQYRDYLIGARAGQTMSVSLITQAGDPYFNILPPGAGATAMYNSSINGNDAIGMRLPATGTYRIRVYQMRAAERRGTTARYQISLTIM
jgi:hypothetical protein